jgi:outer membrane protein OmpA-like peptidoglycan-associated protein
MRQNSLKIINSNCGSVKIYGYSSNDETKKKQKSLASRRAKAVADFVRGQLEQNSLFIEIIPVGKGVIKKGKVAKNRKATATIIN